MPFYLNQYHRRANSPFDRYHCKHFADKPVGDVMLQLTERHEEVQCSAQNVLF
jgi:hypothetical protein